MSEKGKKKVESFEYEKRRMPDSRNQPAIAFTKEVADQIKEQREENGFGARSKVVDDGTGFFYVIQIVPDLDPNRVKLGYARNVGQRLQQHRTTSPTAKLVEHWPCKATWEQEAIDCITFLCGCKLVGGEVYDCDSVATVVEYGHGFFDIMPMLIEEETV